MSPTGTRARTIRPLLEYIVENVAVYRLITSNTVEEWIYQRQIYKHSVAQHVLSDTHNDQRLFSRASLASLIFGKGETASTIKSIGGEVKIEKRPKDDDPGAPDREDEIDRIEKRRDCTVDGEAIEGVKAQSTIEIKAPEKDNYSESEDWVLQRLFKRAGLVVETAVDQNCVTKGSDYRRIDLEAQQVAKAAVASLHKKSKQTGIKSKLKSKTKKSASVLEKIRARRDAKEEAEQPLSSSDLFKKSKLNPNYKLAQKLRDYLEDHWTGVESDQIVSKFDGHVKNSAVFKALLKQMAELDRSTKRWKLKPQFKT